jgi:DNA-binding CsgD family transcriptional regulator
VRSTAVLARQRSAEVKTRVGQLMADARDVLAGDSVDDERSRELHGALGLVPAQVLGETPEDALPEAADAAALSGLIQGRLRDHVVEARSQRFGRVQDVLAEIGRGTSPSELIALVAQALCRGCGFDRALVSRVEGSSWVPAVLHVEGGTPDSPGSGLAGLLSSELAIPLTSGLAETDLVRRRAPLLVSDAQNDPRTFRPLVETGASSAYVAAPIVVDHRVIGLLHADNVLSGRVLTGMDREMVQVFADGFARVYERAALVERVARQRDQIRATFSDVDFGFGELDPTAVRLSRACSPALDAGAVRVVSTAVEAQGTNGLTSREREILALLATGATNSQIAERLVVSESTVKSHVKRILRKLPAANRAEAVYVYLRQTGALEARR